MLPVAVSRAAADARLRLTEFRVLLCLYGALDYHEARSIKLGTITREIGIDKGNASRAIGRLIRFGYVCRGPDDGRLRTYRLVNPRVVRRQPSGGLLL